MAFYNERGVIAQVYSELQAIPVLEKARETYPLPKASPEGTLRTIFQAAEIALLNLANLASHAATDIEHGAFGLAMVKMSWARGFHRVLVRLSVIPHQLGLMCDKVEVQGVLRICDSPAFKEYADALMRFDNTVKQCVESGELPIEYLLAHQSLDDNQLHLLHLARVSNHETTIWERNLAEVCVPVDVPSYEAFVVSQGMRDAVYDRKLTGDTYFTQFRGLHQIPELLVEEINNRIEKAILDIRAHNLQHACEHLRCANILTGGVIASLPPMADNLVASDYHEIRENLGLTSGSHSVGLHYHLFKDLYQQLWEALADSIMDGRAETKGHAEVKGKAKADKGEVIQEAIRRASHNRFEEVADFLLHVLTNECLKLGAFIDLWRDQHLHLPRTNLGGDYTKSLTGSLDAITAVKGMRDAARANDPFQPLKDARELRNARLDEDNAPLTTYFDTESSLDALILNTAGRVTQQRFRHVQEREGVFANKCPFTPPPKRSV